MKFNMPTRLVVFLSTTWVIVASSLYIGGIGGTYQVMPANWEILWAQWFPFRADIPLYGYESFGTELKDTGSLKTFSVAGFGAFLVAPIAIAAFLVFGFSWVFKKPN